VLRVARPTKSGAERRCRLPVRDREIQGVYLVIFADSAS
jgi:hypothetical protein